jgi:hypothetical protein
MRLGLAFVVFLAVSCTGQETQDDLRDLPKEITGRITEVNEDEGQISSVVVESEKLTLEVMIDPTRDYGFNLNHLYEHLDTGEPVRVPLEQRGGTAYAEAIEDA